MRSRRSKMNPTVEDEPDGPPDEDLAMEHDSEYAEDTTDKFARAGNGQFKKQA